MNIVLRIEYDGGAYAGWQRQLNAMTVQQEIEEAIGRLTGVATVIHGAGRTDAGVHALGQVAHFHTESSIPPEKWRLALNRMLPPAVRVQDSGEACDDFHARFWAAGKWYRYILRPCRVDSALWHGRAWQFHGAPDLEKMARAARLLVGEHDFRAFMSTGSAVQDTMRTLYGVEVTEEDGHICLDYRGNGFLYNMVRILTGTLAEIGTGKRSEDALADALETGRRLSAGITAPAEGLYMTRVYYPRREGVPDFLAAPPWEEERTPHG